MSRNGLARRVGAALIDDLFHPVCNLSAVLDDVVVVVLCGQAWLDWGRKGKKRRGGCCIYIADLNNASSVSK